MKEAIWAPATVVLALGLLLLAVYALKRSVTGGGRRAATYDERQQAEQGKAYRAALYALLGYLALWWLLEVAELRWWDMATGIGLGICLSMGVYALSCVFRDAYLHPARARRPGRTVTWLALLGLLELGLGCSHIADGTLVQNGLLCALGSVTLGYGLGLLAVSAALALRLRREARDEES